MKKFIHQLIKFRLGQIFGIFTDSFYGCSFLDQQIEFVPFVFSFSVYPDNSRISGSLVFLSCSFSSFACFNAAFCFFNLIKCFLGIFLKCFLLSPYRSFPPFQLFHFLCYGIAFLPEGEPSSDGSSANTFGIPLQKDATSVGRTYLVRYISALFCFQHPSFSYSNGSSSPSGRCINPSRSVSSFFSDPDSFFPSAK